MLGLVVLSTFGLPRLMIVVLATCFIALGRLPGGLIPSPTPRRGFLTAAACASPRRESRLRAGAPPPTRPTGLECPRPINRMAQGTGENGIRHRGRKQAKGAAGTRPLRRPARSWNTSAAPCGGLWEVRCPVLPGLSTPLRNTSAGPASAQGAHTQKARCSKQTGASRPRRQTLSRFCICRPMMRLRPLGLGWNQGLRWKAGPKAQGSSTPPAFCCLSCHCVHRSRMVLRCGRALLLWKNCYHITVII